MTVFCSGCGTSIADGVKFCPACGKPSGDAGSAAATPVMSTAPPASGGGAMKIVLIVLGIIGLIGVLMVGSCFYVGYKMKKAADSFATNSKPYTGKKEPCSFVSVEEATEALGTPVQSAEARGPMSCDYALGTDGSQHVMVGFMWKGGTGLMKMTKTAAQFGGKEAFTDLPGVGDEAFIAPNGSPLLMRKGDVLVTIDTRTATQDPEAAKKMATMIADRLGD